MSEYQKVCLGELITHQKGFAFKSKDYVDSGVPVVRVSNFTADAIDTNDLKFVNPEIAEQNHKVSLKTDDVIISTVGSWPNNPASIVGKTVRVLPEIDGALMNQNSVVLRVNSGDVIDQKYLFIALKNKPFTNHLIATAQGSANQASITLSDIFSYEIEWPSFKERESIVSAIDSLNQKILLNRETNQTLEQIAQALFKSWFVDFEPTRAKITAKQAGKDPERAAMTAISGKAVTELEQLGDEQLAQLTTTTALFPDELVESELGEVPDGWACSTLGEHFNIVMGQSPKGDTYNEEGNGMLFFQGRRDFNFRFPTPRVFTTAPKRLAQAGDTLISVRAPVGDRNMANQQCCLGRGVAGIKHKAGARSFTYAFIGQIESSLSDSGSDGTVFSSINKKELESISFLVPGSALINYYETLVSPIDKQIEELSIQAESLENLRDTLLPKLLSGELSPTQAEVA